MSVQVLCNEVTVGIAGGSMSHLGIGLVGPGHPILPVVVDLLPPGAQCTNSHPAHHHDTHGSPSPGKPVEMASWARYTGVSCSCWPHLDHAVVLYWSPGVRLASLPGCGYGRLGHQQLGHISILLWQGGKIP